MKTTLSIEQYSTRLLPDGPELMELEFDTNHKHELVIVMKGQRLKVLVADFIHAAEVLRASK